MDATLAAGALLGLSAGLSPGPLLTLVVTQTLRHGFREGAKVAVSPLCTDSPIILLCLLVLSRVEPGGAALGAISVCGALFVAWMGVEGLRARPPDPVKALGRPHSLLKGMATNLLNPHPYLFWFSVGVPLVLRGWERGPAAAAGFLAAFFGCLVGAKLLVALLTARSTRFLAGRVHVLIQRGLGLLLLGFAILLLRDGLRLLGLPVA